MIVLLPARGCAPLLAYHCKQPQLASALIPALLKALEHQSTVVSRLAADVLVDFCPGDETCSRLVAIAQPGMPVPDVRQRLFCALSGGDVPVDMEEGWQDRGTDDDGPSTVVGVIVKRLSAILAHYDNFEAQEQAGGCSERCSLGGCVMMHLI